MTDHIPETDVKPARRSFMDRISIVWIIPIGALLIALGIAWQSYQERGALIEIRFSEANGIAADHTELRFREVSVGIVEEINFSEDLSEVVAHVRLEKEVEPFVDSNAAFWVVQPEVSTRGVSGLNTVLSGVYIQGSWDEVPGGLAREHLGLDSRPLARPDQPGTQILLRTTGRGLTDGAPIIFKGLEVGRIGKPHLAADGNSIEAQAFIFEPHDQLVTTTSRFWNTSGISFKLGAGGASVDFASLTSLINGGVSFETVVSGGDPIDNGVLFTVHSNNDDARASLFEPDDTRQIQLAVVFEENVSGLSVGAPVTLRGLEIGEVVSLTGRVDAEQFGDERVRLLVIVSIGLEHLRVGDETEPEEILDFLEQAVNEGWRARLAKASLLTGGLKIELAEIEDAAPATFQREAEPYPIMPSVTADVGTVGATAEGLMNRVNSLPIEELLTSATQFMENAANLVASPELQDVPSEISALIGDVRNVVSSPGIQEIPDEISGLIADIREVVSTPGVQELPERLGQISDEVVSLLEELRASDGVGKLVAALEQAGDAADSVGVAMETVPQLLQQIQDVATKAADLDLETLLAEASGLVDTARNLIASDAVAAIPGDLSAALEQVNSAVGEASNLIVSINENEGAKRLVEAIEAASSAAQGVSSVIDEVPPLVQEIEALAAKAVALDLETLLSEATGLVDNARTLIGSDTVAEIPGNLSAALERVDAAVGEASTLLTTLNENESAQRLVEAIEAASDAASGAATVMEDLPPLVQQIEAVAAKAAALDLETFLSQATGLAESAGTLLASEAAQALPESLSAALDDMESVLAETRTAMQEFNESGTISQVSEAVSAASEAATGIGNAVEGVPELIEGIDAVVAQAAAMELDALVAEVTGLVNSAEALIDSDDAREMPASINAALDEIAAALEELRAGGTVQSVNAALASTRDAADAVAVASTELPELVTRTERVLRQAELALASVSDSGALNRQTQAALREVTRAAESVRSLARTIERKPNALLTGK